MAKKVAGVAKAARQMAKNGNEIAAVIGVAATVVEAAIAFLDVAKPMLDQVDTDAIVQNGKDAAHVAAEKAGKAGGVAMDAGKGAAEKFGVALSKIGGTRDAVLQGIRNHKDAAELKKLVKDAKQAVLESANATMTAEEFLAKVGADSGVGFLDAPGAFAIVTYRKLDFDKDLTDYLGVFVGKGDNLGSAIFEAMSREGNADVYADVKYKQNVRVYAYNCGADRVDEKFSALFTVLEAGSSYNA